MNATNSSENYLSDLGKELVMLAQKAQQESGQGNDLFQKGRQTAFYEVLSLMKQQAIAFGIDDYSIGLHEVDLEALLK